MTTTTSSLAMTDVSEEPRTSEQRAFERLRRMIIDGSLPRGEFLSQRMLAKELDAAVVTVRNALRSLESLGLIENVPKWGVRIPVETKETIRDRYFLREVLESAAARRVCEQHNLEHAELLREKAKEVDAIAVEDPKNVERFAELHFEFHQLLAECSGSRELVRALDRLSIRTRMLWNAQRGWARGVDRMSHVRDTEAILAGTPEQAAEVMRQHVRRGLDNELQALGGDESAKGQVHESEHGS